MRHYISFKGYEANHYMVDVYFEGLTIVGDYVYDKMRKGEKELHFGGSNEPIVFGNDYTLYMKHIVIVEWHDMTPSEKRKYNKVLKENNLCFEIHKFVGKSIFGKEYTMECEVLCWENTDNMPISVNGEIMTCKEFRAKSFGEKTNVVNSWDNGYSNWGAETNKMDKVYRLLDNICSEHTEDAHDQINTTWRGGKVHCGELWTWRFDEHGALKLSLTEKEIKYSYVSNT